MSRIFVSYRRSDSGESVQAIIRSLKGHISAGAIFFDLVNVLPGQDFRLSIYDALNRADLVLVAIGPSWLEEFERRARKGNGEDYLLIEIETALRLGKLVLPLLVDGAEFPDEARFPATIRDLARRNARSVDPDDSSDFDAFALDVLELLRSALRQRMERISELTGIPSAAIELVFEGLKLAASNTDEGSSLSASKIWESTKAQAKSSYGDDWMNAMRKLKLLKSEDAGVIVYCMMLDGILQREPTDEPADFWELGGIDEY